MRRNYRQPQDDIPDEFITFYIVRDYQRMWNCNDAMKERIKEDQAVMNRQYEMIKAQEDVPRLKRKLEEATKRIETLIAKNKELKRDYVELHQKYTKYQSILNRMKNYLYNLTFEVL